MHRKPLLDMLDRYAAQYPAEVDVAQRIRQLVSESPECFERRCRPGHVTASAWVLSHDQQRVALVHHKKLNRWFQPGGHTDGDADVVAAARREVLEETGLSDLELVQPHDLPFSFDPVPFDLDVHRIPARVDASGNLIDDSHDHHDIRFLFRAAADQQLTLSEESHDVRWFSCQEVMGVTDEESVLRMLRKAGPR